MTEYGRGAVLGSATSLPATTAAGILFVDSTHPLIIAGFIAICCISLVILLGYITRYLINRKKS